MSSMVKSQMVMSLGTDVGYTHRMVLSSTTPRIRESTIVVQFPTMLCSESINYYRK